ncbi:MAG TPA: hypothetical protein VGN00_03100 [Puia sp.]
MPGKKTLWFPAGQRCDAWRRLSPLHDTAGMDELSYSYVNFSFHYKRERYTGYAQMETGAKELIFHLGVVYRFGRPRMPPREPSRLPPHPPRGRSFFPPHPVRPASGISP